MNAAFDAAGKDRWRIIFRRFTCAFRWRRWWRFLLVWLIVLIVLGGLYEWKFGAAGRIYPELVPSCPIVFGNTVQVQEIFHDQHRIVFTPAPEKSDLGGGVIQSNLPAFFRRICPSLAVLGSWVDDTPLEGARDVHLRIKGKLGGEKIELKLRNSSGEGWCVVGGEKYPISDQFQDLLIPLEEFTHGGPGVRFDPCDGLDAVVFGVGDKLNNLKPTEIRVASLWFTGQTRPDRMHGLLMIGLLFAASACVRLGIIFRRHDSAFLCYAREDKDLALRLENALVARGVQVWRNSTRLPLGQQFPLCIADGIRTCRYFLLLATGHSLRSQFVGVEIGLRVKCARPRLLGLEIGFPFIGLSPQNVIVLDVNDNTRNVPGLFATLEWLKPAQPLLTNSAWNAKAIEEVADQIAHLVYA